MLIQVCISYFGQTKVTTNLRLKINHTSLLQQLLEIYVILCLLRDYVSRLKHKWTSLHQFSTVDAPKSMFCQSINSVCSVSKMTMVWSKCIVRTSRSGKFFWWGAVRLRKRSRPVCLVPAFFFLALGRLHFGDRNVCSGMQMYFKSGHWTMVAYR